MLIATLATSAFSQDWTRMMNDKNVNFYTAQKEFKSYWNKQEKKESNWFKRIFSKKKDAEQEKAGWEIFKRWEYFTEQRVYPKGERIPGDKAFTEFENYKKKIHYDKQQNRNQKNGGQWVPLGPFTWQTVSYCPGNGRVNTVVVDPNDTLKVYVGTPSGGFWKSVDGGNTYVCTTDMLATIGVSCIAIDPNNSNIIYIGTGDCDAGDTYTIGVLKSTDGGNTWTTTGMGYQPIQGKTIHRLMFLPGSSSILFASTSDGIYKSLDAGATWSLKTNAYIRDMKFKIGDPSVIYAAGNWFYRSLDSGNTWSLITTGLPSGNNLNRIAIAVTPANPDMVYVIGSSGANSGFYGLYVSTNSGTSFFTRSTSPNVLGWATDGSDTGGQGWYSLTLAVSPTDVNKVYAGGVNIWQSIDGGISWHIIADWVYDPNGIYPYVHADQHFMDFYGSTMYVGCDGGFFRSTDDGNTWTDKSSGLQISQYYRLGGTPQNANMLMTGAQDNGCYHLVNNVWTQVYGGDGMEVAIDPTNMNTLYAESQGGGMGKSTDGGLSFGGIAPPNNGGGAWVTPYMLDPNNSQTLYAGFVNLWKSTDAGATWDTISAFNYVGQITAFNVAPSNSNYIYVYRNDTLYKTTDGGANWTNISAGLPLTSATLTYIAISNTNPNHVWVSFSGYTSWLKVYATNDGGATWNNYTGNLPNIPVNCIVYQNNSYEGLYIGTDIGIFYKDSTLANWQPYFNGLPNVIVDELEIQYPTNKIRAATFGRGVWESGLYIPLSTPPVAAFISDRQSVCPNETIHFTDESTNSMAQWHWSFPGGIPASSSQQNPTVTYITPGTYPVSLVAYNIFGTDTAIQTSYITVAFPSIQNLPLVEGFEEPNFPPNNWKIINPDNSITWEQYVGAGGFGLSPTCTRFNNYDYNSQGSLDVLLTPPYNLNFANHPVLHWDHAYAEFPGYSDTLIVFYTTDCGLTKHTLWEKGDSLLSTAATTSGRFVPGSAQWRTDSVNISNLTIYNDVQFGFENVNGFGNYIYLDNINISYLNTGMEELNKPTDITVFPNPFSDIFTVSITNNSTRNNQFEISNVFGEIIYKQDITSFDRPTFDVNLHGISSGVYFFRIKSGDGFINKKIVKL